MTQEIRFKEGVGNLCDTDFRRVLQLEETCFYINEMFASLSALKSELSESAFETLSQKLQYSFCYKGRCDLYFESGDDDELFVGYVSMEMDENAHDNQRFRVKLEGRRPNLADE